MRQILAFLTNYGYAVLFGVVFAEQMGAPIPAVPVLLAAGALSGVGKLSIPVSLLVALVAALISDTIWYYLGRKKGQSILRLLCKIALEPDSCVSATKSWFGRLGSWSLVIAKFVPGLSTAAPPMAGITRMPLGRFLAFDGAGSLIWAGAFFALGFAFSRQIENIAAWAMTFGSRAALAVALLLGAYIGWKYYQRQRFIRTLRAARITPEELLEKLGTEIVILDVRQPIEVSGAGMRIRGAVWVDRDELQKKPPDIPPGREVVLYCS